MPKLGQHFHFLTMSASGGFAPNSLGPWTPPLTPSYTTNAARHSVAPHFGTPSAVHDHGRHNVHRRPKKNHFISDYNVRVS